MVLKKVVADEMRWKVSLASLSWCCRLPLPELGSGVLLGLVGWSAMVEEKIWQGR